MKLLNQIIKPTGITCLFLLYFTVFSFDSDKKSEWKTIYLFSHGLGGNHKQAYHYTKYKKNGTKIIQNERYLINGHLVTFNFPDVTERFWRVNSGKTSFGQYNEINYLAKHYHEIIEKKINTGITTPPQIVLIGVSRGASAAINFAASYHCKHLKALILESPFDCMNTVIEHQIKKLKLGWIPGIHSIGRGLTRFIFSEYKEKGIHPIDAITAINKDLPILLVCSKEDTLVPCYSTIRLYQKLKNHGHEHVHLLILDHGEHAKLLHQKQGNIYQEVVHAFYKKYNLPHHPEFAQNGNIKLSDCQPILH